MITNPQKDYINKYSVSNIDDFLAIQPFHKLIMKHYGNNEDNMNDDIEMMVDDIGDFGAMEKILSVIDGNYSIDIILDDNDNYDNDYAVIYVFEQSKYFQEI